MTEVHLDIPLIEIICQISRRDKNNSCMCVLMEECACVCVCVPLRLKISWKRHH
jgi:hypothetical protein